MEEKKYSVVRMNNIIRKKLKIMSLKKDFKTMGECVEFLINYYEKNEKIVENEQDNNKNSDEKLTKNSKKPIVKPVGYRESKIEKDFDVNDIKDVFKNSDENNKE